MPSVHWIPGADAGANAFVYKSTLIDAGVLPMALTPYRTDIATIVLTHCHYDHTARLAEIQRMCRARICTHPLDAPGVTDDLRSVAIHFGARPPAVVPDCQVREGDCVDGLTVLHTPGHTPGSICLFDPAEGILFSGDTVFTHGSFGRYDLPGGDRQALLASLRRLSTLDVQAIYPGHGEPVEKNACRHIAAALDAMQSIYA
ncbi:MAG: MBL fold metallo-hydrolase [Methanomicrobiales archaeon]|nr:MBL fold metallo-hydrolase [Methanomicrobiales archaeon]